MLPKATSATARPSRTSGDGSAPRRLGARAFGSGTAGKGPPAAAPRRKTQKALLVGINDYPDPAAAARGLRQRRLHHERRAAGVRLSARNDPHLPRRVGLPRTAFSSRLKWLLDDPKPGDELVFYYSGHGARIPEYGENFEPDHHVESLVPWDFDWSPEKSISDDQIFGLYSQLPYDCRLAMIFDCCHSGGMHRDGGLRPRGITPPDDIRHRELKWDSKTQMWVSRDFARINEKFTPTEGLGGRLLRAGKAPANALAGRRCCAASRPRNMPASSGEDEAMARGPYLPLIIEACAEDEFSYEYRHGATSHGAFTFSLSAILRREKTISFEDLIAKTRELLADLRYAQEPRILGPTAILQHNVPWTAG